MRDALLKSVVNRFFVFSLELVRIGVLVVRYCEHANNKLISTIYLNSLYVWQVCVERGERWSVGVCDCAF